MKANQINSSRWWWLQKLMVFHWSGATWASPRLPFWARKFLFPNRNEAVHWFGVPRISETVSDSNAAVSHSKRLPNASRKLEWGSSLHDVPGFYECVLQELKQKRSGKDSSKFSQCNGSGGPANEALWEKVLLSSPAPLELRLHSRDLPAPQGCIPVLILS